MYKAKDNWVYQAALERIPYKYRKVCNQRVEAALGRAAKKKDPALAAAARERAALRKEDATTRWERVLVARKRCMAKPSKREREVYRKRVADDQNRCWNKFFPTAEKAAKRAQKNGLAEPKKKEVEARRATAEQAWKDEQSERYANDATLPAARRSVLAKMTELYSRHGSWTSCAKCHLLRPRPFQAMDLRREPPQETMSCLYCKKLAAAAAAEERRMQNAAKVKGIAEQPAVPNVPYVPQPDDIPESLRRLTPDIVQALRPLDVDVGPYERPRDGYRVHTSVTGMRVDQDC